MPNNGRLPAVLRSGNEGSLLYLVVVAALRASG
jgi:hypothetical protein